MAALVRKCIEKQSEFNEALGSEILFLFFDTELPPLSQTEAGGLIEKHLLKEGPAKFLFSGHGEAHAMPPSLIEIGRERFRSERPGSQHFEEVAKAVAEAHKKAIPFFQNAFGLEPGINALIFAHRTQ